MQISNDMVRVAMAAYNTECCGFSANGPAMRLALEAALAAMWRPISEAEPNQTYLLGWRDWRDHKWIMEVAPAIHGRRFENGYSNVSHNGSATHFMPLPANPKDTGA